MQVPALLELLQIPYTGSDPTTLAIALDKGLAKRIVASQGVRTAPFFPLMLGNEKPPEYLKFPLLVKPVAEGSVGAGTGMVTCDFKAGIGTSSRCLSGALSDYKVGVLVLSNFGRREELRVDGYPFGLHLDPLYSHLERRTKSYGSIIAVLATNAPLTGQQLNRLSKRVALGIGRVGSHAAHGSGEIILAFSTANTIPRISTGATYQLTALLDSAIDPFYQATIEATEEAILNSLCAAEDMHGVDGHFAPALPIAELEKLAKTLVSRKL